MKWFRFGSNKHEGESDAGRQQEIYRELQQRFPQAPGGTAPAPGVYGQPAGGAAGVYGQPAGGAAGVYGQPAGGAAPGVYGQPAGAVYGQTPGVYGQAQGGNGQGVSQGNGQTLGGYAAQATEAARLLEGDDGIAVASVILHEYADAVHAALAGQGFEVDRRHYRWTWEGAGPRLRSPLLAGPLGAFHPFIQVAASVTVVSAKAKQTVKVVAAAPLLEHLFEILDLVTSGWEYGGVRADTDQATLAASLIFAAKEVRDAMSDEPPLPNPIREQMRRNNTVDIWDPTGTRVVSGFNPGRSMRESLLA
ncbi:hypothetical protein [Actinoplanes derwentensis]|uniref:Uncharacterized protein n=1 Tax=Actinoplanes derwentensis TaxID=113562 RepID=A0A1H1USC3_9ACTN|nr:hypothetical protein [Actinoplanes derwentensis]GID88864.1 hypothetical protein Ade03nite_77880 [Actinoplanes derwentensis]SDS75484.1 hypothetical protein SAMN04489716_1534 [Actinoplanes derwentensis]